MKPSTCFRFRASSPDNHFGFVTVGSEQPVNHERGQGSCSQAVDPARTFQGRLLLYFYEHTRATHARSQGQAQAMITGCSAASPTVDCQTTSSSDTQGSCRCFCVCVPHHLLIMPPSQALGTYLLFANIVVMKLGYNLTRVNALTVPGVSSVPLGLPAAQARYPQSNFFASSQSSAFSSLQLWTTTPLAVRGLFIVA